MVLTKSADLSDTGSMTTLPASSVPLSPDSRLPVFVSSTGKVHLRGTYGWGVGTACSDRFVMGNLAEALVRDIDCEHCMAHDLPTNYEVRVPDRRYSTGYRVVHSEVGTMDDAEELASKVGGSAYAVHCPPEEQHAHGEADG